ncbi:MAG TPA: hypothetical protein VML55_21335 [Planctomycetaceae bacterium]|nr:hypothetical protein [Planctomycetaceae bacterium]
MFHKKPVPLLVRPATSRRLCPVCGTVSYSRHGIHPQCAQQQADAPRVEQLRVARKAEEVARAASRTPSSHPWQKRCPKCNAQMPNRKMTCDCGHNFRAAADDAV